MKMTKKVYRTAMGREVDMQALMLQNEKAVALGNANLNARGDQIDSRGNIVKKREELVQDYYRANPKAVRDEPLEEDKVSDVPVKPTSPVASAPAKKVKATKDSASPNTSQGNDAVINEQRDIAKAYANEIIQNKVK